MKASVGKIFRPVVIDARLKHHVDKMLRAGSSGSSSVVSARRQIRTLSSPATAYLFASEIRGYMEEKTRIGTEDRVFPIAGDLFLDALEANLETVGPNLFKDHYSGMLGCYREGDCPSKAIEGPLYCVDLAMARLISLFLRRDSHEEDKDQPSLPFLAQEPVDFQGRAALFTELADRALEDAVQSMLQVDRTMVSASFLDYAIDHKERVGNAAKKWWKYHGQADLTNLSNHEYLAGAIEAAEDAEYSPLVSMTKEHMGALHEKGHGTGSGGDLLKQSTHPLYDAGRILVEQGNRERRAEAFDLALRRYRHAVTIFGRIRDRTSAAIALVEQARTLIKRGGEEGMVHAALYEGVCLVMAHVAGMPQKSMPSPSDDEVVTFLEKKGYHIEAEAYAAACEREAKEEEGHAKAKEAAHMRWRG
jgi:hypothetical protein